MRKALLTRAVLAAALLVLAALGADARAQAGANGRWSFDPDTAGRPPAGFSLGRTGEGAQGRWVVQAEKDAPSAPNVLAQMDADDTDDRFPVAVANEPALRDARVTVRCKPVSGRVDQACGLVVRYRDENNYYVARANALEGNVRFYYVKDGKRRQLASWSGAVAKGTWHELGVEARGDTFKVSFNGRQIIEAHDKTFGEAGKVGVWTKADSVAYFDDLTATALR